MLLDEHFMMRCVELAQLGRGFVAPNPLVGALIVHKDKIIGEGYHQRFGEAHAEVNAINSVKDKSLLKNATIYVSLEPCSHFGKTPPCADLIMQHKFRRVVIGCTDTFSEVNGSGIKKLQESRTDVSVGILEKECRELNCHFFTFHEKKRPYVFLKWAQTANGFMDDQGKSAWISSPETQALVHTLRMNHQAILVGRRTVENDDPSLTVRAVKGPNPIRVVIDPSLKLPEQKKIFNKESNTIILNTLKKEVRENISYVQLKKIDAPSILNVLCSLHIQSVLIEGGGKTLQSFIDSGLWDEAKVIIGKSEFQNGTTAPNLNNDNFTSETFFSDTINSYKNT
jgi:diaminohydroxyphosphoribosylaminopyrimidine deaminase/5-amino-6-(5-phosphoribosylamino)uracil reductase